MRIALLQTDPVRGGIAEAHARIETAAAEARAAGAAILVLPEMFLSGYAIGPEAIARAAEGPEGPGWSGVARIAARHGLAIAAGGPLARAEGGVWNAACLYGADGSLLASYAKTHLFGDVDRAQFRAGDTPSPVVALGDWQVGLAICYDIEFPEVARALALAGAEAVLVPTANMEPFTSVCTRLVPARAEENGLAIAYANYVGPEGPFVYCGRSCIVGADGEDLARADTAAALLVADLDRAALAETRARTQYLADRRAALYTALTAQPSGS